MNVDQIKKDLRDVANAEKAAFYPHFFKTGPGEYGEGDKFLGVTIPNQRAIASLNLDLDFSQLQQLLNSEYHEERSLALLILTYQYPKADDARKQNIFDYYIYNAKKGVINNWDLVDCSAHKIVGAHLFDKDRSVIHELANSKDLWQERISVMATMWFIRNDDFADTLVLCEKFLSHKHDLIHKVTGWMLREIGKRDEKVLRDFLDAHATKMPRTMLRYAIERLSKNTRADYLQMDR